MIAPTVPPLKGEVPAVQAVGFQTQTLRASIYGPQGRRQNRRQQPAVGPADRQQVAVGPADPAGSYRLYTDRSEGLTACGEEGILYA